MKTCELDGCDKPLGLGNTRFCCYTHFNENRTFRFYSMVEFCAKCGSKMMDSDYHKNLSGTACSKYCKVCRSERKEDKVEAKKDSRKDFSLRFNSMASSGCIKF